MPRVARRHRGSSVGSVSEAGGGGGGVGGADNMNMAPTTPKPSLISLSSASMAPSEHWETAERLLNSLCYMQDATGRGLLNALDKCNLQLAHCLLERCRALDERNNHFDSKSSSNNQNNTNPKSWLRRFLLQCDQESSYTPLHAAMVRGSLATILLYLRWGATVSHSDGGGGIGGPSTASRFAQRPMTLLHAASTDLAKVVDAEGLTPLELLGHRQVSELRRCRKDIQNEFPQVRPASWSSSQRDFQRHSSFDLVVGPEENSDELDVLREHCLETLELPVVSEKLWSEVVVYGCEVVTFGRPHHCALGVISSGGGAAKNHHHHETAGSVGGDSRTTGVATFFPQRVQEFAQEHVLREGSAIAVAAATHHTLVACRNGHLYVFGLNKGGRLGLGEPCPSQCPLPRRILGALAKNQRKVVAVAAAENHSLCVTSEGMVWAWGSNRFGQLGDNPNSNNSNSSNNRKSGISSVDGNDGGSSRSLPKRIEELKQVPCVAVAAGGRHSVALSQKGEVYVWGDNAAGQLGVPRRTGIQKVQRVEALWRSGSYNSHQHQQKAKVAIAIAAAEQSTMVLTSPVAGFAHWNSVYSWGHGNNVPMRVQFEASSSSSRAKSSAPTSSTNLEPSGAMASRRLLNPVAIACAKYHNTALTSDGCVYTWGTSSESLGRTSTSKSSSPAKSNNSNSCHRITSSPQLVTGMLPENGGGFAVAVSASEQHTAVVTDTGALFTWGVAHGKNVMGHEGVRWQPRPKRVPGVHRAINVAVAKEHTVLLIGATFPALRPSKGLASLELLSARKVARYVDLFNVVPILIMAKRTECEFLIRYCSSFVRLNLDGVLNFGKKSVMNQYLNDVLADSLHKLGKDSRDDQHHPFITDVITAGNKSNPTFYREWMSTIDEWVEGCKTLSLSPVVHRISAVAAAKEYELTTIMNVRKMRGRRSSSVTGEFDTFSSSSTRSRTTSCSSESKAISQQQSIEGALDRCINKTANMDLSTSELAHEKALWLAKEIRGVRKKLAQIAKLRESEEKSIIMTTDECAKMDRRPVLESEMTVYSTALDEVEKRIKVLKLESDEKKTASLHAKKLKETKAKSFDQLKGFESSNDADKILAENDAIERETLHCSYSCEICQIRCPDKTSYELHQNGRKHRNRVAQAVEEEKKEAAKSIMAQKQLADIKSSTHVAASPQIPKRGAWGVPAASTQPTFKLPPPPHPVVAQVPPKYPLFPKIKVASTKQSWAYPAGSFKSLLREQESRKVSQKPVSPHQQHSPMIWATQSPGSTRCVPLSLYAAPDLTLPPKASACVQRNLYSIADFLAPKPSTTPSKKSGHHAWRATKPQKQPPTSKSLAQIQVEEVNFKEKEDRAYGKGGGSWFIERRERANSLHAIQLATEEEREFKILVEEQKQIEEQIRKDLGAQDPKSNQSTGTKQKKTSKKNKTSSTSGKRKPKLKQESGGETKIAESCQQNKLKGKSKPVERKPKKPNDTQQA